MTDEAPETAVAVPVTGPVPVELGIYDLIVDFVDGQEMMDLSDLMISIGDMNGSGSEPQIPLSDASGTGTQLLAGLADSGAAFVEVASLTAIHTTLSILYEDDQMPVTGFDG